MLAFVGIVLVAFALFALLFYFFYQFKGSLPYYRIDNTYCRFLLQHAINGDLPCVDWYFFIGALNLVSEELEQLRLACFDIDEQYTKTSIILRGKACMQFSSHGKAELSDLLQKLSD